MRYTPKKVKAQQMFPHREIRSEDWLVYDIVLYSLNRTIWCEELAFNQMNSGYFNTKLQTQLVYI